MEAWETQAANSIQATYWQVNRAPTPSTRSANSPTSVLHTHG